MLCNTTCNTKTSVKVGKMVIDTHKYNTKMIQYISPGPLQLRALFLYSGNRFQTVRMYENISPVVSLFGPELLFTVF